MGTIGIIFGGLMTFAGAYFLVYLVAGAVGMFVTVFFYAVCSNLFFTLKTGTGAKVGVLILAIALAVGAAYAFFRLVKHWGSSIIAALAGGMAVKFLFTLIGVLNGWAQLVGMILGAAGGFYAGLKLEVYVKTIGTAFLGSYIMMRGFGFVFGGFPNSASDIKSATKNNMVIYYMLGFIVTFIAGSVIQYKFFHEALEHEHDKKDGDDAFDSQEMGNMMN
jgi:hypothetical protein